MFVPADVPSHMTAASNPGSSSDLMYMYTDVSSPDHTATFFTSSQVSDNPLASLGPPLQTVPGQLNLLDKIQSYKMQPDSTVAHSTRAATHAADAELGAPNSGARDVEMNDISMDVPHVVGGRMDSEEVGNSVYVHPEGVADGSGAEDTCVQSEDRIQLGDESLIAAEGTSDHEMNIDRDALPSTTVGERCKSKDMQSSNTTGMDEDASESSKSDSNMLLQRPTVEGKYYKDTNSSDSSREHEDSERSYPPNKKRRGNGRGGRGRGGRGRRGRGGKMPALPTNVRNSDISNQLETMKMSDDDMRKPMPLRFTTPIDVDMLVLKCNNMYWRKC